MFELAPDEEQHTLPWSPEELVYVGGIGLTYDPFTGNQKRVTHVYVPGERGRVSLARFAAQGLFVKQPVSPRMKGDL